MINLFKSAFAVGVALAFTAMPAAADVPFAGTLTGTDPLGHTWSTPGLDSLAWGEPGLGAGTLTFNPLGTFVSGSSTSATELDFTFLGSPGIDNVNPSPPLGGLTFDTRFIDETQLFFFTPTLIGSNTLKFVAPSGMTINKDDVFFVNIHFSAPLDTGAFSFAADWINSPIPEPEIYAMMGIGLALMGFVARRRKGQASAA